MPSSGQSSFWVDLDATNDYLQSHKDALEIICLMAINVKSKWCFGSEGGVAPERGTGALQR